MDIKKYVIQWEREIGENPAIALLAIFIGIAALFILILIIDAFAKRRKKKRHKRH